MSNKTTAANAANEKNLLVKIMPLLKAGVSLFNLAALTIYCVLRLLFDGFGFSTTEEIMNVVKALAMGTALGIGVSCCYYVILLAKALFSHKFQVNMTPVKRLAWVLLFIISIASVSACNSKTVAGVKKDFNTGLTCTYENIEPEKTLLLMNGEVLNHTDIPFGESFVLVNDNVDGLTVKDGKVSVGCTLTVTDKTGNVILNEEDLFKGRDVFNKADARYLKCTVSTGEPMLWDENYKVQVKFWDKYGNGNIENNLSIHIIDIP